MGPRERMRSLSDVPLPPPRPDTSASVAGARPDPTKTNPPPPASIPDVRATYGAAEADDEVQFPPGAFSPDDAIDQQIADLERWAQANEKQERSERARFWVLRGTAFVSAVLAAIAGPLGVAQAPMVLGGVAALFIAVDAAWPGASLRQPHRRAVYDLRALQNTIKLRWDKVRLAYPNPTGQKRVANALALLDAIQVKREDIGRYLGSAEASSGLKAGK
jgi:hypothetical protein